MAKQVLGKTSLLIQLKLGERLTEKGIMILLGLMASSFSFIAYANSQNLSLYFCNPDNSAEVKSGEQ